MAVSWLSKAVIGGSMFAGTSVGAGSALLMPSKAERTKSTYKKRCRIHKLISSNDGTFERIDPEELEQEILGLRQGNFFKQIQEICEKVGDKDIFIRNPNGEGWKYIDEQNNSDLNSKFEKYLKGRSSSNT
ncbi:hypothetical protein MHC_03715 [Mycoplasma haemocanis str. Illinois]|uniref:Uncharacterized protein n=1 Tax=Mycoplasma haemocanis (strain Illinois) TaxID=1111676 RepID=H6N7I1_MYCHN|nr:replication initiation protein [Mycoplasma haemocanis]AEW45603.1 hypothetical protein MHC_03715 [Mycoplasma haemocanis str. Illinois]